VTTGMGTLDRKGHEGTFTEEINGQRVALFVKWPYIYAPVSTAAAVWQVADTGAKPWVRADYSAYDESANAALGMGGANPVPAIGLLKDANRVTIVGTQPCPCRLQPNPSNGSTAAACGSAAECTDAQALDRNHDDAN
jgi:hypothetical protein